MISPLFTRVVHVIRETRKLLGHPGSPTGKLVSIWAKIMVLPQFLLAPLTILFGRYEGLLISYLAAYNTSQASRVWNLALRDAITDANPYIEVTIPQHDLELEEGPLTPRDVQQRYQDELDNSDIVIVILDGVENEAWTGFECGYARAKGKYIYGISADPEMRDLSQKRYASMCDELIFFTSGDDLNASHSEISHTLATRTMVRVE